MTPSVRLDWPAIMARRTYRIFAAELRQVDEAELARLADRAADAERDQPDNDPVMCGNCGGIRACDIAAHEARREVWHLA